MITASLILVLVICIFLKYQNYITMKAFSIGGFIGNFFRIYNKYDIISNPNKTKAFMKKSNKLNFCMYLVVIVGVAYIYLAK